MGSQESSVAFNLRQLMQLEQDRLQSEADSQRALQLAAAGERAAAAREQAEREALRRAAAERTEQRRWQVEREAAERVAQERDAALLRVRLEAEAAERSVRERGELAIERARSARRVRALGIVACVCGAVFAATAALALRAAAVGGGELARVTRESADRARELAILREQFARNVAPPQPALPVREVAAVKQPQVIGAQRVSRVRPRDPGHHIRSRTSAELEDIDAPASDPIEGL